MKKPALYLFFGFLILNFGLKAQAPTYNQLLSIISEKLPAVNTTDRIIAFHVWSSADATSRAANKEFDRVTHIYHGAKLKNGGKGAIIISCNADDNTTGSILFHKDGIEHAITIQKSDYAFLSQVNAGSNVVYDNTTAKIYENLTASAIFNSYNQLITR